MKRVNLYFFAIFMLLFSTLSVQASGGLQKPEIEECVDNYFQVLESGDDELLISHGAGDKDLARVKILADNGLLAYHVIQVYSHPLNDSEWAAIVYFELEISDIKQRFPGMITLYIMRDDKGNLIAPINAEEIVSEETEIRINKITSSAETERLAEKINREYEEALESDESGKGKKWFDKVAIEIAQAFCSGDDMEKAGRSTMYTVAAGDSLWSIAEGCLGSGQEWTVLYKNNRQIIGENPALIFPGQELILDF